MRASPRLIAAALAVLWLAVSSHGAAAQAQDQDTSTYVAATGNDANDCFTAASACRSLPRALNRTLAGGVVFVGDGTYFSIFTIDRPVVIKGTGGAMVFGNFQLIVRLPAGASATFEGLRFQAVGSFSKGGVVVDGQGKLTLKDCRFDRLTVPAIEVKGLAGARVLLDNVTVTNSAAGVRVSGASGAANLVFIQRSTIDANGGYAVQVDGAANNAVISSSTLSGSSAGPDLSLINGGRAVSYRNNVIRTGTPTQTLPTN